jgi:hypothetical protein
MALNTMVLNTMVLNTMALNTMVLNTMVLNTMALNTMVLNTMALRPLAMVCSSSILCSAHQFEQVHRHQSQQASGETRSMEIRESEATVSCEGAFQERAALY